MIARYRNTAARAITINDAITDPHLLGAALGPHSTWSTWRCVLKAAFGSRLRAKEKAQFATVAGNRAPPQQRVRELWAVIGRRGGKSRIAAALAVYVAAFTQHRLARGERGMVLVLAASQAQARTVFDYVRGFLEASPVLQQEIAASNQTEITLRNGIIIAVQRTASAPCAVARLLLQSSMRSRFGGTKLPLCQMLKLIALCCPRSPPLTAC